MELEILNEIFYMILILVLGLFFVLEAYFEKNKPKFGHTTGIIVTIGVLISLTIYKMQSKTDQQVLMSDLQFNESLFFDLILPMIIFPSGYNMRRKKFFRNISTIMKFGFVGTIICFATYSAMTYGLLEAGLLTKTDPETGKSVKIDITMFEILSLCSLLCSSDVIAAISMISYED